MEFRQAFPIAIIDEDFEGKHAAGRGHAAARRRHLVLVLIAIPLGG